ncbi:isoprenylcysteine carboxylmethyltransferase family protein [Sulfurovum sp.]|jgi:protein-S-isoprenylcysteine O-methyltransferase Ste14|uniref:methyltransferase family protein n=1 Tax=Sulfurovum sp. TaxID=1969726 RepID=UPI0025EDA1CD|nr:isoprenylcysteine carboxylmethyltransferase family protein [Sulfurovum sp.]
MKIKTSFSVVVRIFLWFVMIIGGAVYSLAKDWHSPLFNTLWFHILTAIVGIFLLVLAFRAAANGGRELTKGRVGDIPRLETNRLVTTGIFSCMRHPMLFGLTLLPLGWALLLGSPTFIVVVAPLEMLFIIVMVLIFEEMEVKRKFGKAYDVYREEVPMVSFRWKCLNTLFKK